MDEEEKMHLLFLLLLLHKSATLVSTPRHGDVVPFPLPTRLQSKTISICRPMTTPLPGLSSQGLPMSSSTPPVCLGWTSACLHGIYVPREPGVSRRCSRGSRGPSPGGARARARLGAKGSQGIHCGGAWICERVVLRCAGGDRPHRGGAANSDNSLQPRAWSASRLDRQRGPARPPSPVRVGSWPFCPQSHTVHTSWGSKRPIKFAPCPP